MSAEELVARYRSHAADCIKIAHDTADPAARFTLLSMAQAWLVLADQAIKNSETTLVYETPLARPPPSVAQQQQQIQPDENETNGD
jgi:hypothetical protein